MSINQSLNWEQSPLYDTYELAISTALPTKIVFFENPTGGTKGRNLTNLMRGFELVAPEMFVVAAMRIVPVGMSQADIVSLTQFYTAKLIVGGHTKLEAPIDFWAGGAGISGMSTASAIEQYNNGVADPRAIASINPEDHIILANGESFSVELNGVTFDSAAAIFLRVYLDGRYGRSRG